MYPKDFDANAYVKENSSQFSLSDHSNIGAQLRCIDDRASVSDNKEHPIAVPGGGLGLVMDVMGACTLLRRKGKHVSLPPAEITNAVERAIGTITFHTDEKNIKNKNLVCGGCGHAHGALTDPVKYLLSETDAKYFVEQCLDELHEKLRAKGKEPLAYAGSHAAGAVMIVEGLNIALSSIGKSGAQVYVYHKSFHELLLKLIANEMLPLLASHNQGVSEGELESALIESAQTRLSITLQKLATGLPQFRVSQKETLVVEPAPSQ